ncbi:hypothetical protein K443DRAFT_685500 [Laccaria amethystina LaAM-08-1]|uniref:Uncharacterized protein n=1 Tax=Laccaria amethystina LaAM-08-1 TaxID=1095629 RepID=A0A0C9WUB7_9AGAR|nr:hypothetical protein K443DRAFT_685500 [Laccaria amethystina LaAM-08-1]
MSSAALELIAGSGRALILLMKRTTFTKRRRLFHHIILASLWLPNLIRPTAGHIFFVLPYLESWRKREDVWLRPWLASLFDYQLQGS